MRLDFSVFGEEQLSREMLRYAADAGDASPALHEVADDMREQIREQFETEGRRGSGGWEPDAEATLAAKAAAGLDPHVLRATDELMNSLIDKDGKWHVEEITESSLLLGSKDWVGFLHQSGTDDMPARKPVDFTETDRRGYVRTLQRHFAHGTAA